MSNFKDEILELAETTALTNKEIARVVGCSIKTVSKYAGSFITRVKAKGNVGVDSWDVRKTVLLPDIHHPHYDKKGMEAVNQFIFDYDPDELVYMGDQVSLDCISPWDKRKPRKKEGKRLLTDFENFNKEILQVHENLTRDETDRIFMIGNHEMRINIYVDEHPELEGIVDIVSHLNLKDRGYKIVPFNEVYKVGKLNVIHGYYWNMHHAKKTVEVFEGNVAYAHVHNPQMYTKLSPIDRKGYHMATCLPCLSTIKPDYKKNAPNFWVNGFGIVESLPATGFYNLYMIIIIDGSFMWNGRYYGKKI